MFYATLYKEGLKRNNTICVFKENNTIQVGEIVVYHAFTSCCTGE